MLGLAFLSLLAATAAARPLSDSSTAVSTGHGRKLLFGLPQVVIGVTYGQFYDVSIYNALVTSDTRVIIKDLVGSTRVLFQEDRVQFEDSALTSLQGFYIVRGSIGDFLIFVGPSFIDIRDKFEEFDEDVTIVLFGQQLEKQISWVKVTIIDNFYIVLTPVVPVYKFCVVIIKVVEEEEPELVPVIIKPFVIEINVNVVLFNLVTDDCEEGASGFNICRCPEGTDREGDTVFDPSKCNEEISAATALARQVLETEGESEITPEEIEAEVDDQSECTAEDPECIPDDEDDEEEEEEETTEVTTGEATTSEVTAGGETGTTTTTETETGEDPDAGTTTTGSENASETGEENANENSAVTGGVTVGGDQVSDATESESEDSGGFFSGLFGGLSESNQTQEQEEATEQEEEPTEEDETTTTESESENSTTNPFGDIRFPFTSNEQTTEEETEETTTNETATTETGNNGLGFGLGNLFGQETASNAQENAGGSETTETTEQQTVEEQSGFLCPNGERVAQESDCPFECEDGSFVDDESQCPFKCEDGSFEEDEADCPENQTTRTLPEQASDQAVESTTSTTSGSTGTGSGRSTGGGGLFSGLFGN